MRLAIHHSVHGYSNRWIQYCEEKKISYKIVDCYQNDIIEQLKGFDGLLWHWAHTDYKAVLFARQLALSLEKLEVKTFPDVNSGWHFDDKVGQKYLLEAMHCPLVQSYVFYSKKEALKWLELAHFPKVFKLRGGASSVNVSLVETKTEARKLIFKAFTKGFLHVNRTKRLKDRFYNWKKEKNWITTKGVFSGFARMIIPTEIERFSDREKGYIYFQDFVANNDFDTRLVVIGNRCFGARRFCRKGDFRASGSGLSDFNSLLINMDCVSVAFEIACKLSLQSVAFDFILDNKIPKIVEISYCFPMEVADYCTGFWDKHLVWHDAEINAPYFMIEDFIDTIENNKKTI